MKTKLILLLLLLAGCEEPTVKPPCVVIRKYQTLFMCTGKKCVYVYQDANELCYEFCDYVGKYSIGDTLK